MVKYSVTYGIVTPKSAENAEYAETGYEREDMPLTLDDDETIVQAAADVVEQYCGHCEASSSGPLTAHDWFTSADTETDYSDGSETSHSVHFAGLSDADMQALAAELTRRGLL